jgi:hypothetical protein
MARPISRGVLSFGLVSIPVELYSAIEDHNIRFHLLHKKCGSRVRNQLFCPVCKVVSLKGRGFMNRLWLLWIVPFTISFLFWASGVFVE